MKPKPRLELWISVLIALQGRTTFWTSDRLGTLQLHRFGINISIDVQDRANFQFPTATGEYQTTTKTKSNAIVRIGSTNYCNSKSSKLHDVLFSCSRPKEQLISKGQTSSPSVPRYIWQRCSHHYNCRTRINRYWNRRSRCKWQETTTTIVADSTSTETIDPTSATTSLYFRCFIQRSAWRFGSLLSLVRDS